ncbi:COX15/CtaA family protein [Hyphomicrobium nitrativorans]|uniref:COX15/CtaA family protein n=1 Tax=Hyphomicrobium nitrativorans TaxID=1427356 RepID=UPI000AA1122F|nr:COX15/CtaA family protein [Hyphomicrobium nitrativorans]
MIPGIAAFHENSEPEKGVSRDMRDMAVSGTAKERGGAVGWGQGWDQAVVLWLWVIAGLVLAMITVGGATRLTDSGLSITEWQPILGTIPPLTEAQWQEALEKYRQIPQYQLINKGMSLEDFKFIFWWEWGHRFLGRIIGLAFALPLLAFWFVGALKPGYGVKFLGVLALGGLQGVIGWYMVKSGLVDRVDVSQYRLALHLTVAFVILAWVVWLALDLAKPSTSTVLPRIAAPSRLPGLIVAVLFAQVVLGAFVAGLKGGLVYNTWPSMNGAFVPYDLWAIEPWYLNPFENPVMAQFNHRLVAYAIAALAALELWRTLRNVERSGAETRSAVLLMAGVMAQVALGIWTLLAAVPIGLGIVHQAAAAVLLVIAVRHLHVVRRSA